MLSEKQDNFTYETAGAFRNIAIIVEDKYHSETCMFPDEILWALRDGGKEELADELEENWKNASLYPSLDSGDELIQDLANKVAYIRNNADYLSFRLQYLDTTDQLYKIRANLLANIEKVNEVLKHVYTSDTRARIMASLQTLHGIYDVLNNSIISPVLALEGEIVKIQESFNHAPSNLPDKYHTAVETISEGLGRVYNDMVIAVTASKNMPEEDDLKGELYSDLFFATYSNAISTIQSVRQTSLTVCSDIQGLCERIKRLLNGESNVYDFVGTLVSANYDEVIVTFRNQAKELEPLLHSAKKELQRLESEREEKKDSKLDEGIETINLLVHQLNTILEMAEKCPYSYMNDLSALKSNLAVASKELLQQGIV
jgi:hypothetical protein